MGKISDIMEKSGHMHELRLMPNSARVKPKVKSSSHNPAAVKQFRRNPTVPTDTIDPHLIVYHDPASTEAEIFKILRNNILFPKEGSPPRSIMVTSAIPGDGKSFVAANLAVSIAQGVEEHVLLMDCDMRRSSVHRKFGYRSDQLPGLSDYLSKGAPLPTLLRKTAVAKLTILPGGKTPDNPAELLSSQMMKRLLAETKGRYPDRYIIVDSPPPQLTAETTALANYVDGIIIVVRAGKTPRTLIEELVPMLGREKLLGVVLNGYQASVTERYEYGHYKAYKKA